MGRRALICALVSIAAPIVGILVIGLAPSSPYPSSGLSPLVVARIVSVGLELSSPVLAILGLVFAAKGMSRRFANRGAAIAGLVISIVSLALALVLTVAVIASTGS